MTDLIAIQKIAGWEKLKTLVLNSVSSPITKRVYNMALDDKTRYDPSLSPRVRAIRLGSSLPHRNGVWNRSLGADRLR